MDTKYYLLPYRIKADWKAFLILLCIFEIPFIFAIPALAPIWIKIIIISFLPATWWLLLSTFEIKLTENKIIYHSLFSKDEILYSEISSIRFSSGIDEPYARGNGFFRLVIQSKARSRPLVINMKLLTTKDLAILTDVVLTKNPSLKIDKAIERIRARKLKEVILSSIK